VACTPGAAPVTLAATALAEPSQGGGQVVIGLLHVTVNEIRAPERAQGLGPRLGLAGWSFFVTLVFELRKVRPHRVFLGRHRSVSARELYADLTSTVSGSAIADGMLENSAKKTFFAGPICFQRLCQKVLMPGMPGTTP
jgi:hypothetical protein